MKITKDRWQEAQIAERKQHTFSYKEGFFYYKNSYDNYFDFLGINYDQSGKTIIEIGCADFPALEHCTFKKGYVVEPMPSEILEKIAKYKNLTIINKPVEEIVLPKSDEVWLFNVMQHIIDPDLFILNCKNSANVIRFFEPINYGTCVYHPHDYTLEDFIGWFGSCVKKYEDKIMLFHEADCAYGSWYKL